MRTVAGWAAAAAAGFAVYLRLAQTRAVNSDAAAQALQAWDMAHGNPLLRGWTTSDVSFYTTELPQYLLIELVRGLSAAVPHDAAALTYTLVVLLVALLAASRPAGRAAGRLGGRQAAARAAIAAGIMLAPQLGAGTNVLLSSPDHIGTSVPLLLTWLVLDRARPRWYVPAVIFALLAWAQVADSLVLPAGVVPLAGVCLFRLVRAPAAGPGEPAASARAAPAPRAVSRGRYEAALGAGAVLSVLAADLVLRLVHAAGGFSVRPLGPQLASASEILGHNLPVAGQCLLLLGGADFAGAAGSLGVAGLVVAALHLAGVAAEAAAFGLAAWRLRRLDRVSQVLVAAIAVNVAVFALTNRVYAASSAREIAPVLPCAAALAGRVLGGRVLGGRGPGGRVLGGPGPGGPGPGGRGPGGRGPGRWPAGAAPDRVRAGTAGRLLRPALGVIAAGYLAGLGAELTAPAAPPQAAPLTSWLERHHLGAGLSGYWEASVVTLTSGGRVAVRPVTVTAGRVTPNAGEVRADWFSPSAVAAHYVVLFPGVPGYPGFTDRPAVLATFGPPARVYRAGAYTVWYWPGNLLADLGGSRPPAGHEAADGPPGSRETVNGGGVTRPRSAD